MVEHLKLSEEDKMDEDQQRIKDLESSNLILGNENIDLKNNIKQLEMKLAATYTACQAWEKKAKFWENAVAGIRDARSAL